MATPVVTKTAWKLQEIVAHASNVSSLVLGKASGRLLATGGDDCRVNLWSINKPNCIMVSDDAPHPGRGRGEHPLQALLIPAHISATPVVCSVRPRIAQDSSQEAG